MQLSLSSYRSFQQSYLGIAGLLFLLVSCDPTIDPIHENDLHYSIFGFLDASADTQFIRIEKLRDGLSSDAPAEIDAEVMLTNLSTGQEVMLQDSLFHYLQGKAHNYYTVLEIEPTDTYRLEVREGQSITSAEVNIPPLFPEPDLLSATSNNITLEINEIDRLVAVNAIYYSYEQCSEDCPENPSIKRTRFEHLPDTTRIGGEIRANIDHESNVHQIGLSYGGESYMLQKVEVMVAAGNPDWPDFLSLDRETTALPQAATNVNGGIGLLGGIVTDTMTVLTDEVIQ